MRRKIPDPRFRPFFCAGCARVHGRHVTRTLTLAGELLCDRRYHLLLDIKPKPTMPTLAEKLAANRNHAKGPAFAAKLRALADRLDPQIENMRLPSTQNPTPKRNRERASRLIEAALYERTAQGLRALADRHDGGFIPIALADVVTKDRVMMLLRHVLDTSGGYYSIIDTGRYADTSPAGLALQGLLVPPDPAAERRREIERRERDLILTNIPGFFQTPPSLCRKMVRYADIGIDDRVLEPSAGNGNIADLMPGCHVIEPAHSLREILELKGHHLVASDFLAFSSRYDRIVMNPPFENGRDMEHVRHAYGLLERGGRLVAILSPAYTFHRSKAAAAFRDWIADKLEHEEEIPAGTFAGPETVTQTQIAARLVVLIA